MAAALVFPATVAATNFGSNASIKLAEDSTPGVAKLSLSGAISSAVDNIVPNVYGPTDLNPTVIPNQTNCADVLGHDICVLDNDEGLTVWWGITECIGTTSGAHPDMRCSRQRVRINLYSGGPPSSNGIICHETGHAVGLHHSVEAASCLNSNIHAGMPQTITAHDIAHINAHY